MNLPDLQYKTIPVPKRSNREVWHGGFRFIEFFSESRVKTGQADDVKPRCRLPEPGLVLSIYLLSVVRLSVRLQLQGRRVQYTHLIRLLHVMAAGVSYIMCKYVCTFI